MSVLLACMCFRDSLRKLEIGFGVLERFNLLHLQDSILIGDDVYEIHRLVIHFKADGGLRFNSDL